MNDKIHCFAYQSQGIYHVQWMFGDKVLFSEYLRDAFKTTEDNEKHALSELLKKYPDELVDAHVSIMHMGHSVLMAFCRRERVDMLLGEALRILDVLGEETFYSNSFKDQLENYRERTKNQFAIIAEKVDDYRRRMLTEQLETLSETIRDNTEIAHAVKRRRRDMEPVIDALERMAPLRAPEPVPVTERFVGSAVAEPVVFKPTFTAPLKKKTAPKPLAKPATPIAADDDLCCEL